MVMNYNGLFKDWFKQRRKSLDFTQKELAAQVHCSLGTVHGIEQGVQRPSRQLAELLAVALQVPPGDRETFVRWARSTAIARTMESAFADASSHAESTLMSLPASTDHVVLAVDKRHSHESIPGKDMPNQAPRIESFTVYAKRDWGEAPDIDSFQGRQAELEQLNQWIVDSQCKLIAVLGMGGIGKTAFATHVAANLQDQFAVVIWRSLRNALPLEELLDQYIHVLAGSAEYALPTKTQQKIAVLLEFLRGQRCLLVLDNFESILQDEHAGHYLPGFEGYGELLQRIGEGRHQSCLLLTSREKPKELVSMAGATGRVRTLALSSLPTATSRAVLQDRGLHGTDQHWADLNQHYSGNPLALQIAAETIRELFNGDIADFLAQDVLLFSGISSLLEQQFARLSALELEIMFWLAVEREPVTLEELTKDLVQAVPDASILHGLHSLRQRFLVERVQQGFTLQNVVLEYATAALIDKVCAEIRSGIPVRLRRQALLKATAKNHVRESQRNLILKPIAQRMIEEVGQTALTEQLKIMLAYMRRDGDHKDGYAGGNVLNLMVQLEIAISSQDFSQLAMWQADLRSVSAQNVNFRGADLSQSAFTDTFSSVLSLAFSPDGRRVAAASMGEEIHVWQASDGKPLLTWQAYRAWLKSICFSPDGTLLAGACGDQTVRLWIAEDGTHLATLHGHTDDVRAVCFSPDGEVLASSSFDRTVRLWDWRSGECLRVLQGHAGWVNSVCFGLDGEVLASGSDDETIRLWDWRSGECLRVLQGHAGWVNSISCSPHGGVLASGGHDRTVRLWDMHTGEFLGVLQGHTGWVGSVCFSANGEVLASGGYDQTVRLWDSHTGKCLHVLRGHTGLARSVCFSPDGDVLASGSDDQTVRLWDSHTGTCLHVLQGHRQFINSVSYSPDGELLASGGHDQMVRLWDTRTGACCRVLSGHTGLVKSVCFSPEGATIASGGHDQAVRLWNRQTGKSIGVLQGHTDLIRSVCFSPDGNILASGSDDATVRLWSWNTGECLCVLQGHTEPVRSIAFCPDSSMLASCSHDHTVRLWDWRTGECLHVLQGHTNLVRSVGFSPNCEMLVSGSDDQTVRLWDRHTGVCLRTLRGHNDWVNTVCFSPDGIIVASGSYDLTVRLWDSLTGDCLGVLQGHTGWVGSVCFSPSGDMLASCSYDETIRLWDATTGLCLQILCNDRPYERMNITGATGLTRTQVATLKRLGAVDEEGEEQEISVTHVLRP